MQLQCFLIIGFTSRIIMGFNEMWIGGNDVAVEGEWRWADSENFTWPDFIANDQPGHDAGRNCLITTQTSQWWQGGCAEKKAYLCEVEIG